MSTELRYQLLPNAPLEQADILIQPIPFAGAVSNRQGTAEGPAAILNATAQLEYYEEDRNWSPMKHLRCCVLPPLQAEPGAAQAAFQEQIHLSVAALPNSALYIGLGGDHSITPEQVSARMPEGTVIIIDAHADLRAHYEGNPYSHACPAWRMHEAGYSLFLIGIRSLFESEADLIDSSPRIQCWKDRKLQNTEQWQTMIEALRALSGPVWLSIDMDGFDPSLVPGVGTPQPGGLGWYQVLEILETLLTRPTLDLRGMDIVELIPDSNEVSQTVAAKLMQKAISNWAFQRYEHFRDRQGAQLEVEYS
jgi:agmatinase